MHSRNPTPEPTLNSPRSATTRVRHSTISTHVLVVSLLSLCAISSIALTQERYDNEINIALDRLLPESLIASGEHRVANARRVSETTMAFDIESETGGMQSAESIALAVIRIHEARTLAQAIDQFMQANRQLAKEGRGQINVGGDSIAGILSSPLSTSASVVGQFGSNVKRTLKEVGEFPGPKDSAPQDAMPAVDDPVFLSHRRSVASQLKLDVYSTNASVQSFLDAMARARGAGRARAGITTVSLAGSPELEVESGRLRERVRSAVLNEEQDAVFNDATAMLVESGIDEQLSVRFLNHTVLTATHKAALTEYIGFMKGVRNGNALIAASLDATNEVQALAKVRIARMYANYHEGWTPLDRLISAGHLALALNRDGALLVALPFDFLAWTPENERIFSALREFTERKGISSKAVLLSGVITNKARAGLESLGFDSIDGFLFKR